MNKPTLYNLSEEANALIEILEDCGGELTPELEEIANEHAQKLLQKADAVGHVFQRFQDQKEIAKKRKDELTRYQKSITNQEDYLKRYVISCMEKMGVKKLIGELISISLRKPSDVLEIIDKDQIRPEYIKIEQVISYDKEQMKKDIKDGIEVDGVALAQGKKSLLVKTKAVK